jgi:Domain of unknown function (DUF4440)
MKSFILMPVLFFLVLSTYAQNGEIEKTIRALEQVEVKAILDKDSATLLKLWDANYTVNSPDNAIYVAGKTTLDRPVLKRARTSFTREVELVTIKGDFVFTMGSETVVPAGGQPATGSIVKRRFTNIWEKQQGQWKLVGRHANVVCSQ